MSPAPPFTDPARIHALYTDVARANRRSNALLDAKVKGRHVGEVIAGLLADTAALTSPGAVLADVGCGTGHPARTIARRFPRSRLLEIDASAQMLNTARSYLGHQLSSAARRVGYLRADFHHLPLADATCAAVIAVFCLYHSAQPGQVIAEIARCLAHRATAVLVTKSADSYHELDGLIARTGLDPEATGHPSLYQSAHGEALPGLVASALRVRAVIRDRHVFRFRNADHVAEYLITVPKYRFHQQLRAGPAALAAELRRRRGDGPVTTTSTITYVVAHRDTHS